MSRVREPECDNKNRLVALALGPSPRWSLHTPARLACLQPSLSHGTGQPVVKKKVAEASCSFPPPSPPATPYGSFGDISMR